MRNLFFILIALNLAFMAWAGWIDRPASAVESTTKNLPRLRLAGENSTGPGALNPSPTDPVRTAEPVAQPPAKQPAKPPVQKPRTTSAPITSSLQTDARTQAAAVEARTNAARAADTRSAPTRIASVGAPATGAQRCLTIGPFKDVSRSGRAATLLRERGFIPRPRMQTESWAGYWVYVGGLTSEMEQANVVRQLEGAGISDAHAMPLPTDGTQAQVSVGLFSDKDGADRRARSVRRLGLAADISERNQTGTWYWVDLNLDSSTQPVPTEGLLALEEAGSRLEMKACPRSG